MAVLPQRHPHQDGADRDRAGADRGPRERDASFDPVIVRKRQRRLDGIDGIDEIVLSLTARGLTTGEIAAHFAEVYGAKVSRDTISRITDKVLDAMAEWQDRPLDAVYPVLFIDAIHVKVRDGQVTNRPFYVAIGVTVDGHRDILGIWAGDGGEGAKYWLHVLTEIKNRGVVDACIVVCDGLRARRRRSARCGRCSSKTSLTITPFPASQRDGQGSRTGRRRRGQLSPGFRAR